MGIVLLSVILGVGYAISISFYNLFLHPLRNFPGPILNRISRIPRARHLVKGDQSFHIRTLQEKYGPVVRIAPDELAYIDVQAWKDIYGHRSNGDEFSKPSWFYRIFKQIPVDLLSETRERHAALRRQLAHGFSDKAMRTHEPIITNYVNILIQRLHEQCHGTTAVVPMRDWFWHTTFDVIGDLGFGSPFGCLGGSCVHPWIRLITTSIWQNAAMRALISLVGQGPMQFLFDTGLLAGKKHQDIMSEKLAQRMELGHERPDLIEGLLKEKDNLDLSFKQLTANSTLLMVAGSLTTATFITGSTFLLVSNPDKLKKLVEEVRSSFASEEEINLVSVGRLSYMLACLNEGLRRYPPVTTGLPRTVPKGGASVAGQYVPEGTTVAVWQWAINHRSDYWSQPFEYIPERWLEGGNKERGDQLDAMQPFSAGPRNCIGRNLAFAEARLILARVLYNFDIELDRSSQRWLADQKSYAMWDKPQLNLKLTPVVKMRGE
ncbi:hypothetical protein N8I77_010655 [Diaporthe amygdali]|uniref:Uncharacterized protein n=1 Tax=Phomopsis amygdali TaxID=1214568 RepID=A0AAD9S8T0_PHOAM|nr:hypothetical protein N8I77_010655 [Diaporthe amygdali]